MRACERAKRSHPLRRIAMRLIGDAALFRQAVAIAT
jgi:hypothetical protein